MLAPPGRTHQRADTRCSPGYRIALAPFNTPSEAATHLDLALSCVRSAEPPLWTALVEACYQGTPEGAARLIVFASTARKNLFVLAMLARHNITTEDLRGLRTWIVSLGELRSLVRQRQMQTTGLPKMVADIDPNLRLCPLFVGLPGAALKPKLLPLLLHERLELLVYPHQGRTMMRRVDEWGKSMDVHLGANLSILSELSGLTAPSVPPYGTSRVHLAAPVMWEAEAHPNARRKPARASWGPDDPVTEMTRLIHLEEDDEREPPYGPAHGDDHGTDDAAEAADVWCESAFDIQFNDGWHARFPVDERVYVIVADGAGQRTEQRYVRSLRIGDRVVLIYGQRRQNLYDLIISRIHAHPSMEMHLALINRWQSDVATAYQRWRRHGKRNMEELLLQLQQRGSALISPVTLRQWVRGETLCPQDKEDLRRLAEVLNLDFVRHHYLRIYQAASRLRGLHRGMANRLNHWLEHGAVAMAVSPSDDVIDAELGLTFADFRNSLLLLRVIGMRDVTGPFLRSSLGEVERVDDGDHSS